MWWVGVLVCVCVDRSARQNDDLLCQLALSRHLQCVCAHDKARVLTINNDQLEWYEDELDKRGKNGDPLLSTQGHRKRKGLRRTRGGDGNSLPTPLWPFNLTDTDTSDACKSFRDTRHTGRTAQKQRNTHTDTQTGARCQMKCGRVGAEDHSRARTQGKAAR